ncbi:MAG TPA: divalent metal cation transporter [Baekduia sp.]|nr:divalent metal cation transporter [Baekduia sp.]
MSTPARRRRLPRRPHPGRSLHLPLFHLVRLRHRRAPSTVALLAVMGPGLLAGLSDDDPAGITTYSVLGADYGYELLWVLALSTVALIVFHEIAARTGVVTGRGLAALVRERYGHRAAHAALAALVVANVGTIGAEFAGIAAGMDLLVGAPRGLTVPFFAAAIALLVLRASFHRVEHVLLALSAVFITYVAAGLLAHPDWGAAAHGLVVPAIDGTRRGVFDAVATLGTTLAPWGLAFMQSYAVDKRLTVADLRYERIDVAAGAVMTGVIGFFIVVACAATLHAGGVRVDDAGDAAQALGPLVGDFATTLFGLGFLGAAVLAAAIVPLSTAYSVAEGLGRPAGIDLAVRQAPAFYGAYAGAVVVGAGLVLIPGVPLVPVLVLSQALNAVLLLAVLPFLRALAADPVVMGEQRLGRGERAWTALLLGLVALSVVALGVLVVLG